MSILLTISNEPTDRVSEKHVCYYVYDMGLNTVALMEVSEVLYKHPEAPNNAFIPRVETRRIKTAKKGDEEAAAWIVLEAAQKSVRYQQKKCK